MEDGEEEERMSFQFTVFSGEKQVASWQGGVGSGELAVGSRQSAKLKTEN